jgi:hypothetical protein
MLYFVVSMGYFAVGVVTQRVLFEQWGEYLGIWFFYATCYLGFEVMASAFERRSGNFLPSLRKRRLFWRGTAIIIVSAFVGACIHAARSDPGLPKVAIKEKTDANNGNGVLVDGPLLAHTDGFWYVFEDEGKKRAI